MVVDSFDTTLVVAYAVLKDLDYLNRRRVALEFCCNFNASKIRFSFYLNVLSHNLQKYYFKCLDVNRNLF